jgi:two-component system cell cycle sensor histidine kinase/response regulator CckA
VSPIRPVAERNDEEGTRGAPQATDGGKVNAFPESERRTVLVVDDDAAVGSFVFQTLLAGGYDVKLAFDEQGAVTAAREGRIDLLISDIVLGDAHDGLDVQESVRSIQPAVRVLFMSGYGSTRYANTIREALLEKPFSPNQLLERVELALEA